MSILYQNFAFYHLLRYRGKEGNCSRHESVGRGGSPIFLLLLYPSTYSVFLGVVFIPEGAISTSFLFFIIFYFLPSVESGTTSCMNCFYNAPRSPFFSASLQYQHYGFWLSPSFFVSSARRPEIYHAATHNCDSHDRFLYIYSDISVTESVKSHYFWRLRKRWMQTCSPI